MNMVEKVARAMYDDTVESGTSWDDEFQEIKTTYLIMARAAIEAMREPTDRMADDGYRAMHHGADDVWKAMIDAALTE